MDEMQNRLNEWSHTLKKNVNMKCEIVKLLEKINLCFLEARAKEDTTNGNEGSLR